MSSGATPNPDRPIKMLLTGDCVHGDTEVMVYRGGSRGKRTTVRSLYQHFNKTRDARGPPWNTTIPTHLLWDEGGHTGLGKVIGVVNTGCKKLLELRTTSKKILAAAGHCFRTPDGWIPLEELSISSSKVYTWDRKKLNGQNKQGKPTPHNYIYSVPYHPHGMRQLVAGRDYKRIATARLVIEARINKLDLDEMIAILRKEPSVAANLHYIDPEYEVHHLDGNSLNDDFDNLEIILPEAHKSVHQNDLILASTKLLPESIESIKERFPDDTYDIMMDGPHHNFIANGISTHNSGTGKSGGNVSLLLDGYKLRYVLADPGDKIDILLHCLHHPKSPYFAAAQKLNLNEAFRYEVVNHKMITMDTGKRVRIQPSAATVWPRLEKLAHEWKEADGTYLGPITSFGPDTVYILDSFTFAGFAALFYAQELNNKLGAEPGGYDGQRFMYQAQDHLDSILRLLCSDAVKCHVIVITHINYHSENWQNIEDKDTGTRRTVKQVSSSASDIFGQVVKAYPTAIGKALGPRIGAHFSNVIEMKIEGNGRNQRRLYYTVPTGSIAVRTSAPYALDPTYPIETGLARIFYAIRGTKPDQTRPNPTTPTTPAQEKSL